MAIKILVVAAAAAAGVNCGLVLGGKVSSLGLASFENGEERRRPDAAVVGSPVGGVAGAEEGDGNGSRAAEGGLAVDEVGDAGAEGGGGGRGGGVGDAGAGAGVVAVGAEADEAVAEAGGADAVAPPLRGVFLAFPHLLFFHIHRHSNT